MSLSHRPRTTPDLSQDAADDLFYTLVARRDTGTNAERADAAREMKRLKIYAPKLPVGDDLLAD